MDKYIQFHPKIRERFQNALEKSPEQLNQFYKQKFLNKMLYHFKLKFGNNNEILKEVLQNVFDKSIVNYQDFYYFYEVLLQDLKKFTDKYNINNTDIEVIKPLIF